VKFKTFSHFQKFHDFFLKQYYEKLKSLEVLDLIFPQTGGKYFQTFRLFLKNFWNLFIFQEFFYVQSATLFLFIRQNFFKSVFLSKKNCQSFFGRKI